MPKRINRLVCNVRVEHKTKGNIQFVPQHPERPLLLYQSPPPMEDDELTAQMPFLNADEEPDPREVDPYRVADRVYQLMLAEARALRMRGGR